MTVGKLEAVLLTFLPVAAGLLLGYLHGTAVVGQEFADYRAEHRAATEAAALALLDDFTERQRHADELVRQLSDARDVAQQLKREKNDALSKVTTGEPCLTADVLRVLDRATGIHVQMSNPAGGADGENAARVATDTDLGRWILDAGDRYAECVERYHALIDWFEEKRK